MDKNSNSLGKAIDESFFQFCLQTLPPLVNYPLYSEDKETVRSYQPACNCSKSGCLKLYCECFLRGSYCIDCNCINCYNLPEYESMRNKAIGKFIVKNVEKHASGRHKFKGCICRKSNCLKKYCRCHVNGRICGDECKCVGCKNFV